MPPLGQYEFRATMPLQEDSSPVCFCCRQQGWCDQNPCPEPQTLVPSFGVT